MSADEISSFMTRYFAALNKDKSPATVGQYVAADSLKQHIAAFESAFPGYQLTVDEMVAEGDRVAVALHVDAVHRGAFLGIAPTGKRISIPGTYFYRVADGRIVDFTAQADLLGLAQQLGATIAVPTASAA
jgi:predicted ester cyclase